MFERQRSAKALVAGAFGLGLLVAACGGTAPQPSGSSAGGIGGRDGRTKRDGRTNRGRTSREP